MSKKIRNLTGRLLSIVVPVVIAFTLTTCGGGGGSSGDGFQNDPCRNVFAPGECVRIFDNYDLRFLDESLADITPHVGTVWPRRLRLMVYVQNQGPNDSPPTRVRFYRSTDTDISTSDSPVGEDDQVSGLARRQQTTAATVFDGPVNPGTYYYGACVIAGMGDQRASNNCSRATRVVRPQGVLALQITHSSNLTGFDFQVGDVRASDTNVRAGQRLTISITVRNVGSDPSPSTRIQYYRSTSPGISRSDVRVGQLRPLGGLPGLGSYSDSITFAAPLTPGTYYYGACVDVGAGETDRYDNCSESVRVMVSGVSPPPVPSFDLGVGITSGSAISVQARERFTISASVINDGPNRSPATTMRFYRSSDSRITTSDVPVSGSISVSSLPANARSPARSATLVAPSSSGTYYYGACVDSPSGEAGRLDNCSTAVRVTVSGGGVSPPPVPSFDLGVGITSGSAISVQVRERFTISASVINDGPNRSPATTMRFYRSSDSRITTSDVPVSGDFSVGSLPANARSPARSATLVAPSSPGTYFYGACVDSRSGEAGRLDNCSTAVRVTVSGGGVTPPPVPRYDLRITNLTVSDTALQAGQQFTIRATVRNDGPDVSALRTLRYYRSTDSNISGSDAQVGTDTVGSLAASGTSAESISLSAPSTAGTYYYGACVDAGSFETNRTNNCSAGVRVTVSGGGVTPPPTIRFDLEVGNPTVSHSNVIAGQSFTISAIVRNDGPDRSPATAMQFYRSSDSQISTSDSPASGNIAVERLSAFRTSSKSATLSAPSTPGTYYYGACVDVPRGDSDPSNNCSGATRVTVGEATVDLTVWSFEVNSEHREIEFNVGSSSPLRLVALVGNDGNTASPRTTVRYYRSRDSNISRIDTLVGSDRIDPVLPGPGVQNPPPGHGISSITVSAPSSVGTYYYGACVDSVSRESNTGNNCSDAVKVSILDGVSITVTLSRSTGSGDLIAESLALKERSGRTVDSFTCTGGTLVRTCESTADLASGPYVIEGLVEGRGVGVALAEGTIVFSSGRRNITFRAQLQAVTQHWSQLLSKYLSTDLFLHRLLSSLNVRGYRRASVSRRNVGDDSGTKRRATREPWPCSGGSISRSATNGPASSDCQRAAPRQGGPSQGHLAIGGRRPLFCLT